MPSKETEKRSRLPALEKMIQRVDKSDLKSDFDSWPDLAANAWTTSKVSEAWKGIDSVLLAGMGGSGIVGSLICDYASELRSKLRFSCVKDYHLPSGLGGNTLVVGVSCSGNTEETLSVLSEAHLKNLPIVSFGSGGLLKQLSEKWLSGFTQTKTLKVPRSSFPGLFFAVLKFFSHNDLLEVKENEVQDTIDELSRAREIAMSNERDNSALNIAEEIAARETFPLIYSEGRTHAVGLRFRQSLNENSKIHAFNGNVPEICHNDIVGWDAELIGSKVSRSKKIPIAISLTLDDDLIEIKTRFEILQIIIRKRGGKILPAPYSGKSYLSKIITMLYLLDYATYYAAILRGIDPIKTPSIDQLKSDLGKKLGFSSRLEKQYL